MRELGYTTLAGNMRSSDSNSNSNSNSNTREPRYLHHLGHNFGVHHALRVLLEVHAPLAQRIVDPTLLAVRQHFVRLDNEGGFIGSCVGRGSRQALDR